jgi:hypothetical protein
VLTSFEDEGVSKDLGQSKGILRIDFLIGPEFFFVKSPGISGLVRSGLKIQVLAGKNRQTAKEKTAN